MAEAFLSLDHPMAFKSGTSLSKVYRIIDRFSEDVDVTIDYRAFDDGFGPFVHGACRNQITRFSERLRDRVTIPNGSLGTGST